MTVLTQSTYKFGETDSLFAATQTAPVVADGFVLAAVLSGELLRGTPLIQGATPDELTPVTADSEEVVAILAENVADASTDLGIVAYQSGEYNKFAIQRALDAASISATVDGLTIKARTNSIYFKTAIKAV